MEKTISKYTAAKIVKKHYEDYYDNQVNIKVKVKNDFNDLYMIVKKISILNGKKIIENKVIYEWEINGILKTFMENNNYELYDIMYEPHFHNIILRYNKKDRERRYIKFKEA